MDLLHPESAMAMTEHRREAVRLAKSQEAAVVEKCKRSGGPAPGYLFDELIGKGSFGRVYKGRQTSSKKVVAIKVIDIDDADYRAFGDQKDEQITDFNKEIRILRQAQDSGAPNLNQMIEALPVHSQLWLVCEYCPGGSVKTLMRATNDKLGERFIIVVARELSKALKGLHDAGIMHRDIKAANVLIHEEGRLQLCDFGVATVLDKKTDKRRTFIGTLHWMPPELWDKDPEYSDEVDVWAFGCTLYECAVGKPPNADIREPQQLKTRMRRLNQSIELPAKEVYSPGLRKLVSYTLTPDAATRPSFADVLQHELLLDTDKSHPTSILSELVKVYYSWLYGGGQRASLFMPGGAVAGDKPGSLTTADEDWNFSATDNFENRMSTVLNIPDFSDLSDWADLQGESTPKAAKAGVELTEEDKANFEERVRRGADLSNLFDQDKPNYEYVTKKDFVPIQRRRTSDLPLRAMSEERPYSIANQVIDLGDFDSSDYAVVKEAKNEKIKLADAATIKANRGNSKLYSDTVSSDSLTRKPSLSAIDDASTLNEERPRPDNDDFSFPPKEWNTKSKGSEDSGSSNSSKPRNPAKHRTMEWSFESAMSEAQTDETKPTTIAEEEEEVDQQVETRPKKHDTMQWSFSSAMAEASTTEPHQSPPQQQPQKTARRVPPPLKRSVTEPVSADLSRPSTSYSSSTLHDDLDPFALEHADRDLPAPTKDPSFHSPNSDYTSDRDGDGDKYDLDHGSDSDNSDPPDDDADLPAAAAAADNPIVLIPALQPVDPAVLDSDAHPAALADELAGLLTDFKGVLGAAAEALSLRAEESKRRRRSVRGGLGSVPTLVENEPPISSVVKGEKGGESQSQSQNTSMSINTRERESEWEDEDDEDVVTKT